MRFSMARCLNIIMCVILSLNGTMELTFLYIVAFCWRILCMLQKFDSLHLDNQNICNTQVSHFSQRNLHRFVWATKLSMRLFLLANYIDRHVSELQWRTNDHNSGDNWQNNDADHNSVKISSLVDFWCSITEKIDRFYKTNYHLNWSPKCFLLEWRQNDTVSASNIAYNLRVARTVLNLFIWCPVDCFLP